MVSSSTSASTLTQVSFANLFGILISIVLTVLFLIFTAHSFKYLKTFSCKIKIIINRANDKLIGLKDFNYKTMQGRKKSPYFEKLEAIFKNEVKKSRSLEYVTLVGAYMSKYNHIIYYPFRDKITEKYDLLKPKSTFFNLLVVSSMCVTWMITIFISSLLQQSYSDVSTINWAVFVMVTFAVAIIASIINLIIVNRLFRLYTITTERFQSGLRSQV